jgi:hypothetical protein
MIVTADGVVEHANDDALRLLDVTLDELRALPPGSFSAEAPDPEASAAFQEQWAADGKPDIGGMGSLKRQDGSTVRVRFAIAPRPDGRYMVLLEELEGSTARPTVMYTNGEVLSQWRAAERRLDELVPGTDDWANAQSEIELWRSTYQALFRRLTRKPTWF